jgi:hypothetical protein
VNDASLEDAALQAFVGRTIQGRYRIDALLGSGGMGAVFRAHHSGLGHDVALKVLRPHAHAGEIATARFRREARSASRLEHPSCVRVLDFGELEDGAKYLVMQLVLGDELKRRLGSPWPPLVAIDLAMQILAGLAHAHARGVVHRDLKPENVLVTEGDDGQPLVKLVDFGIAKLLEGDDGEPRLTHTGMRFGTPRYMSPEQAGGGKVDERTDLYAVGLLLYEMLAGHPPFVADDVATIMRMQILTPPPPLPSTTPPALEAVVMRLLAKSRKQRFATAKDTMAALSAVRAELATPTAAPLAVSSSVVALPMPMASAATTAVGGMWAATPTRRSSARVPLLVGVGVLACLWIAAAVVAATTSRDAEPAGSVSASAPAPAPAPASVERRGDDACEGSSDCTFTCGEDCSVECEGPRRCVLDVGPGSEIECTGPSECDVTCRGDCVVERRGPGSLKLRCAGERDSAPRSCDKHSRACGPCP